MALVLVLLPVACASAPARDGGDSDSVQVASLGISHAILASREDANWVEPAPRMPSAAGTAKHESEAGEAESAKPAAGGQDDLAKKSNNPIADLISLPIQSNWNFRFGPDKGNQYFANVQPVWPIALGDGWNLVTRTIVPIVSNPGLIDGDDRDWGLGNTLFSALVIPPPDGDIMWGVGPAIQLPTSTARQFGPSEWGAGPTGVFVWMPPKWVIGGLANNVWGFDDPSDTNFMTIQPFAVRMLEDGWYLASSPVITAQWRERQDDRWLIPMGGGVGKVFTIWKQPINATLRGYYNVRRAEYAANWTLQLQVTFLFPK